MYKSLMGLAAAGMLAFTAAPTPADAFAARHAPDLVRDQANTTQAQYWYHGRPYRRWYPYGYYRAYPYRVYPRVYAYPYPYRYYYRPGPFVRIGPFGFGVW